MCDTLIAAPEKTSTGFTMLAKNSDRPPNEAQLLEWVPQRSYQSGGILQCTYLEIPQVPHTWATFLSRPFWMWGAEMGVNQHGLAIGNEAIYSRIPAKHESALLGMDLLRLGLERAASAPQAVDVITSLLEEFGQGGVHVKSGPHYYHNSFLIADPRECWVLETVGKQWAARRVDTLYSISNLLSLGNDWDRSSENLEDYLVERGLAKNAGQINLAANLSDLITTTFADGKKRCTRSRSLLEGAAGEISLDTIAGILRDHGGKDDPLPGLIGADICMHASLGPIRVSQTTGSLIASLEGDNPLILATGTAAPCTSIFKPVWVDTPLDLGPEPRDTFDPATLFWAHERLHREVLANYPERIAAFQEERNVLENEFIHGAQEISGASQQERAEYSRQCFNQAGEAEDRWLEQVRRLPTKASLFHGFAWRGFNKAAGSR
jgi:secernin